MILCKGYYYEGNDANSNIYDENTLLYRYKKRKRNFLIYSRMIIKEEWKEEKSSHP